MIVQAARTDSKIRRRSLELISTVNGDSLLPFLPFPPPVKLSPLSPYRFPAKMARITVEDSLKNVPNLFELVLVASRRARKLANGAEATLDWENDKPTVLALREIAAGHVGVEILEEPEMPPPPPPELMPEPEFMGEFRAPQIGLGD